ncbi:MAG: hypothetical protein IPM02_10760 [Betaproteobacteria bacterium]|nr:hypothetical protein [Betaproteobacteria bacterium]
MTGLLDLIAASAKIWGAHPVEFAGALMLGIVLGYFLSRLRYQGTIDAQKAHLAVKDESIKLKDAAIASESASAPRTVSESRPGSVPKQEPIPIPAHPQQPHQSSEDPRFTDINVRVVDQTNTRIPDEITNRRYKFVYNPETGKSKSLTFDANGKVGQGQNGNEYKWQVIGGRLEILNDRGEVYSRFFILPDGKLHHTNDRDTRSIKGQYLEPVGS